VDVVLWVALPLTIIVIGIGAFWIASNRNNSTPAETPSSVSAMGYGDQRWEREAALWRGTLRRLEIQAKYESPPSESLQRQIDEAQAKLAEAERHM
jgi:hypothetical protein